MYLIKRIFLFLFFIVELVFLYTYSSAILLLSDNSFYLLKEQQISSAENAISDHLSLFEVVENFEENEEEKNRDSYSLDAKLSSHSISLTTSLFDLIGNSILIGSGKYYRVSMLILFHSWKNHI
ncbi:MAG: hypothetical protein IPN86_01115 [Saprospiraceae bacterium]|nr:hypothetical protein [Saprospiraceae bacterium]